METATKKRCLPLQNKSIEKAQTKGAIFDLNVNRNVAPAIEIQNASCCRSQTD